ncbi:hypothetical protein BH24ACT4_BH24ACT4_07430 [soil metagenome]
MSSIAYPLTDPAAARPLVDQALQANKFTVNWTDEWNAEAEVGSKAMVLLAGGFKPHILLQLALSSGPEGAWLHVHQATTGAAGGALGMSKTKKAWQATTEDIAAGLRRANLLTGEPQES